MRLTKAQEKALEWLSDGEWKIDAGRLVAALNSASLQGLCDGEWGDFGARGGRKIRWRITERGRQAVQKLKDAK